MSEQIGLNYQGILANQKKIGELEEGIMQLMECMNRVTDSLTSVFDALAQRIIDLEEKERARARDEHERDVNG